MRLFFSISAFSVVLAAVLFSVYVHKHVPEDCPDRFAVQVIGDLLSFCERLAELTDYFGFNNRWWPYRSQIWNQTNRVNKQNETTIKFKEYAGVQCVVITPDDTEDERGVVIFYHGGGWVMGSIYSYLDVLVEIAEQTGTLVMAPEYRLAPEHPFPIPYEDSLKSTIEFLEHSSDFHIDLNKIVIMGDSAGGNLALSVVIGMQELFESGTIPYKIGMQVIIYPYLQFLDFKLPSHTVNKENFVSPNLIQKCFLAYAGKNYRMDLADFVQDNQHVDTENKNIRRVKQLYINSDMIDEKYKTNWVKPKEQTVQSKHGDLMNKETIIKLTSLMLDVRMSPIIASDAIFSKLPRTHVFVCHYDPLRDDGLLLFKRLQNNNVDASLQYLPKSPHGVMSIGNALKEGYHHDQNQITYSVIKEYLSGI